MSSYNSPKYDALMQLLGHGISAGSSGAIQGIKGDQELEQEKLKDFLKGERTKSDLKLLTDLNDSGQLPEGSGAKVGDAAFTRGFDPNKPARDAAAQANKLEAARSKHFKDLDKAMDALHIGDSFLQDPNGKNLSDVKAMAVQLQGLPARAFGAEAKASGFDPSVWSNIFNKINQWNGDATQNPLTADDLAAFRNNWKVMRTGAVKKYDADRENFWGNIAPTIAPMVDIKSLRAGDDARVNSIYGDYHKIPWEQPNNPGQPALPTQPTITPNKSLPQQGVEGTQSLLHTLFGKPTPQAATQVMPPKDDAADFQNFYNNVWSKMKKAPNGTGQ